MAGITLAIAEARLAMYLDWEIKAGTGQEITMDGKRIRRPDLAVIQQGIKRYNTLCHVLGGNDRLRVVEVIPR